MTNAQIRSFIELLEHIRRRPAMYIGPIGEAKTTPDLAEAYLLGIDITLSILGKGRVTPSIEVKRQVIAEHGWKWPTAGLAPWLRSQGRSDAEIIDAMFAVEIKCWKRILATQNAGAEERAG